MSKILCISILALALASSMAEAQVHKGMSLQTFIKSPNGASVNAKNLTVKVDVLSPNNCVLMEEIHNAVDITDGYMGVSIGQGNRSAADRGFTMKEVFNNLLPKYGLENVNDGSPCDFVPNTGEQDSRKVRLSFAIGMDPIQVEFDLRSVPYAIQAEDATSVQGLTPDRILTKNDTKNLNQSKLEEFFQLITTQTGKAVAYDGTQFVAIAPATPDYTTIPNNTVSGSAIVSLPYSKLTGVPAALTNLANLTCADGKMLQVVSGAWACVDAPTNADWNTLANKPSTFSPAAHGHYYSDLISNANVYLTYKPNNVACSDGEVLKWNGNDSRWVCGTDNEGTSSGGSVTSVTGGTGLLGGTITSSGTLSVNVGTNPGQIVQIDSNGKLPALDGSQLLNVSAATFTGVIGSNQITGTIPALQISGLGSAAFLNVGVTSGSVVQLDGSGKLPAIDGSQLTGIVASSYAGPVNISQITGLGNSATMNVGTGPGTVAAGDDSRFPNAACGSGNKMRFDGSAWICEADLVGSGSGGSVTAVTAGSGLLGGTITTTGTLSVDVGTGPGQILQLDASGKLPGVDGSQLTGVIASSVTGTIGSHQITGSIPALQISGLGTAAFLNVGTTSGSVVQLDGSGKLPSLDGSQLTNITATNFTGNITASQVTGLGTAALLDAGTSANNLVQLNGTGQLPAVDGSLLTNVVATSLSGTIPFTQVTGTVATSQLPVVPVIKGGTGLSAIGTSNQLLGVNPAGTALEYKTMVAGSGITLNNTAGTLTISATGSGGTVTNVTASAPLSVTNGSSTPALSITQANASTNGYLSSADWTQFNSKLSAVSNTASLTSGKMWVGDGSGKAQEATMSGDATMTNAGVVTLKNTGSAGTYVKVTTDAQGRVTSGTTTLAASDIPNLDWSKITTGKPTTLAGYGITDGGSVTNVTANSPLQVTNGSTTPAVSLIAGSQNGQTLRWNGLGWAANKLLFSDLTNSLGTSAFSTGSCTAGTFLNYSSVTDSFGCSSIPFSQVTGSVSTTQLPTVPVSKGGTGLSANGSANQVVGMNAAGNAMEYKTLTAGSNITITNASGSVTVAAAAGRTSCPAGYSMIGSPGVIGTYCIQDTPESAKTWIQAVGACHAKGGGAHLCSAREWITACVDGTISNNSIHNWLFEMSGTEAQHTKGTDCDGFDNAARSNTKVYRCCY